MHSKLLTIIVPTYNRAGPLALLLEALGQELAGFEDRVDLIVGDNASTDDTPAVIAAFQARCPAAQVMRHPQNLGPDENFCRCLDQATGRFFWIIGDDDLPRTGLVASVCRVLEARDPDLLYLGSDWRPELSGADRGTPIGELKALRASSRDFAGYVNVWVTFISGMVVNKARLLALQPRPDSRRYAATNLVQLGWVLPLLMAGDRLFVAPERCMLATSGNTGGYKLVEVFATNLPKVLDGACGPASPQRRNIMRALAWNFLPTLLWMTRFGKVARFSGEDVIASLAPLRGTTAYCLVLRPILSLPRPLALPLWMFARLCGRAIRGFYGRRLALAGRIDSAASGERDAHQPQ